MFHTAQHTFKHQPGILYVTSSFVGTGINILAYICWLRYTCRTKYGIIWEFGNHHHPRVAQKNSTFEFSSCTQKLWWCYLREAQKCLGLVSYFKNDPALCITIFGSVLKEKRLKTVQKVHFFNICWFLIQKWKTHETNVHSTILGECWHEKVALVFGYRHSKSHFWAPEYGHFWPKLQKVPIFRGPKMGLWVSVSKNWGHFFMPTFPQNGGMDICFMRLPLLGEKSANI